jgi:hypothetical protein
MLHLRLSPATCRNVRRFISVTAQGRSTVEDVLTRDVEVLGQDEWIHSSYRRRKSRGVGEEG